MNATREYNKPVEFFILDFLLTWVPLWLVVAGISYGWFVLNVPFMVTASLSATVAALVMIYSSDSSNMVKDYWDRVFNIRRIGSRWWFFILLFIPVINLISVFLSVMFGKSLSQLQLEARFLESPILFTFLILIYGPLPEELGWRGYGIDSLRNRFSLLTSSLILAFLWSVWHVPLFFIEGSYQNQLLFYLPGMIAFFIALVPAEIITDWLFYKNNRSTLAAILFHFSINFSGELLDYDPLTKVIQCTVLLLAAIIIVHRDKGMFFARNC